MELSESQITEIEELLARIDAIDPAELPDPATDLANLLGSLLEEKEGS